MKSVDKKKKKRKLKQAASSEEVRVALGEKNSKEGIGNEIDLMISGDGAVSVVTNLSDLKLFGVVFALPSSSEPAPSEKFSRYISFLLLTFGNLANWVP
ncbi:BnaC02g19260D [Brassica napus]|uniref:BnaC02g19260D protein n=1 Tax=Brassica napus TaxID=3708 RepID=A0A078GTZ0_BRANA|nr:BnaC02g19260D [Brassica napus]